MKKIYLLVLLLTVFIQLAVPVRMILNREKVLRDGERFSFKTRPIDPADPFQGRFVRLQIQDDYCTVPQEKAADFRGKQRIYAAIEVDEDGYARFTEGLQEIPESSAYLKTRTRGGYTAVRDSETCKVGLQLPFNRFYMEEDKAPRAERIAADASRRGDCWVDVRILNGRAVIEDVYVEGESIRSLSRAPRQ
ncbi:GDYXXLXY domain-containing protein [Pontiella agarivorans]|uniref:GDYXXLXY domain-containing protein n=1 Tax=Pontiella agarivorans TaxID=3038953 RepID=A0ABU5MWE6_9BACT|nr:GDYXXLXY domain-containing protein [Pontiella agarivorans]MDZ8118411.1 GDYXXLXY domain-containing protein [Pontiella agarivorans]